MEKKQLDLHQPLLSVRRFSPTLSPSNVMNKKKTEKSVPHRQQSLPLPKTDYELGEVVKPAAVPFVWEHIPGRPKGGNKPEARTSIEPSNTPRLPPGRYEDQNALRPQIESSPLSDSAALWEKLTKVVNGEEECDSESGDDGFSDALDTISPTETLSMNCSVSDLSGYAGSGAKPCGTFCADVQTRDFMMKRFLPAAKAMVLDTPQYVPKKQSVTPERPRPVKTVVSGERKPICEQKSSAIVPHYGKYTEDRESEEEVDECDNSRKKSVKMFGLFSRFCLKNSMCLLNPVPGMKARTQVPISSVKEVKKPARTAYSGPLTRTGDKHSWGAVPKLKSDSRSHSHELHKVNSNPTGESTRLSYSGDLRMMRSSSPYRGLMGGISPYRNEARRSPSPFRGGRGFVGVTKDVEKHKPIKSIRTNQDVLSHQRHKQASGSTTPTFEKTLYVDSVNTVERPVSESVSSGAASLKDYSSKDFAASVDSSRMEDTVTVEFLVEDLMEDLRIDQSRDQLSGSTNCSKLNTNSVLGTSNLNEDDEGNNPDVSSVLSPLPPPLPKSPSESWLWRTLPSIPLRHQKKQRAKASDTGTKWETIVKTSNVHHDHMRYSEELVPHVSQHSKTQK
ncbi:Enolase [Actinidia chinensis var. chinensis]|uniref:Enolase n=1 Tax=Actinidia chinensis var. chinensis TaxID=1590841 RepID=A0A2R6PY25_ACTCC|nr:Enolase [Actinidia chinensis var. chinensis]